jgi:hypothetical protein
MAKKRRSPATRFLWIVAIITLIFIAGAILYRVFQAQLLKWVLVPNSEFVATPMPDERTYRYASMWISRPGIGDDPSKWRPQGMAEPPPPRASVFFVHPTSFLQKSAWNGPVVDAPDCAKDDNCSQWRASLFVRSQASAFNGIGEVWAPKYRQATFGAFLTEQDQARQASTSPIATCWPPMSSSCARPPRNRPIILAGHSQGSFHLLRLLHERIKGSPSRPASRRPIWWDGRYPPAWPAASYPPRCLARWPGRAASVSWSSYRRTSDPADERRHLGSSAGTQREPARDRRCSAETLSRQSRRRRLAPKPTWHALPQ